MAWKIKDKKAGRDSEKEAGRTRGTPLPGDPARSLYSRQPY